MSLKKKIRKTKASQFAIFDNSATKHIDALQAALVRASRDSILPELYDIFGRESLLKFLDIFAGTTVKVPTKKVLEDSIRDTFIYLSLEKTKKSGKPKKVMTDVVRDLAGRYSIGMEEVWAIYRDMQGFF
jgi:hypothetical protein